jgi:gamma-glutamyltranspeptidase/glutathione hydrolase/leukotriene-C4 hydrolase
VIVAPALEGTFAGRRVLTSGAPTSGPVLLHMLKLADRLGLVDERSATDEGERVHLLIECMKCMSRMFPHFAYVHARAVGFAARTRICDPAYTKDRARITEIPTEEYADAIFANITRDRTHPGAYYNPSYAAAPDHGTSHVSAYSALDGTAASVTSTVNLLFGAQVLDAVTGIILNDEMDDFSTPGTPNAFGLWPSPWNFPAPGKRPLSSIAPAIVERPGGGGVELVLGGSGGSRIFGAVFNTIMGLASGARADVREAVEAPRAHDQLFPPFVDVDDSFAGGVLSALRARGHNVSVSDRNGIKAVVNAVHVRDGVVYGACWCCWSAGRVLMGAQRRATHGRTGLRRGGSLIVMEYVACALSNAAGDTKALSVAAEAHAVLALGGVVCLSPHGRFHSTDTATLVSARDPH